MADDLFDLKQLVRSKANNDEVYYLRQRLAEIEDWIVDIMSRLDEMENDSKRKSKGSTPNKKI